MSRHFSLPTVLRMVPNALLRDFFEQLNFPCYSLDWRRLGERQPEPILRVLELWPEEHQETVEAILRDVFDLACEKGMQAICDAAVLLGQPQVREELPDYGNLYHRAMWTWLEYPDIFDQAVVLQRVEHLTFWRKRTDVPRVEPRTRTDVLDLLAREVSRLLTREQGRGQRCSIEHFRRDSGTDYFFCYPDDFVRTDMVHDDKGTLEVRTVRSTFEVVFAYHRDEGTLELAARVPSGLKAELEDAFCGLVLDESLGPRLPNVVYDLNRLKDTSFRLETDPADRVHARLRWIQLDFRDRKGRFTIDSWNGQGRNAPEIIQEFLEPQKVCLEDVDVSAVSLNFRFERTTRRRGGSATVNVSWPDRCNLRNQSLERQRIVRKHLKLWRLTHV